MARRKRRNRQRIHALKRNAWKDFKRGDYSQAIETWEQVIKQTPNALPANTLAEAYFRRGLERIYHRKSRIQAGLEDIQKACELASDDACYTYHYGLAQHQLGDTEGAIRAYQVARELGDGFRERVAYPLALALLQSGEDPSVDPAWNDLSDEEQAMLEQASTFRRRPYKPTTETPLLWQALAALDQMEDQAKDQNERERASDLLDAALETASDPIEQGLAHYYQGVLAGREEDWDKTRRHWNAARAAGLAIPRLKDNLGELYHRLAEERLIDSDPEGALAAANEAARNEEGSNKLQELISQAHQQIAYRSASNGQWQTAHDHWEAADEAIGGGFRLAYNLALAHERAGEFVAAGERWRETLRRRPRRDDHPDAIDDEQVALLWRRSAEAYTKAGEYDEAVNVYKNAVKWNPDHLDTRMQLAETLLHNGQLQAAENELERILDINADYVPALLRMGEVISARGSWWRWEDPTIYWERALKLDPDNATARQLLVDHYQNDAEYHISWGNLNQACEMYQQALEILPKNGQILAALGGCYLRMGDDETAERYIQEALTHAASDLKVYEEIIHTWFDLDDPDEAWSVLEQAEAAVDIIPYEFYLAQAHYCIQEYVIEVVRPWIERTIEHAPPETPIYIIIGEMAVSAGEVEVGQEYLSRALEINQQPGQAHLLLGILAILDRDVDKAEQHWKQATRIARRNRDTSLEERIEHARILFSAPPGLLDMLFRMGPGGPFPPDFYDDDDEDYF
jgi:tetratricopeptide (TPR) repeat protein